jgi:2,4-diaminopentanoate dehydrogenase
MSGNQVAAEPKRVVQWTTGNVGRQTVRAVAARPDLELVGAYARSASKVGVDVGELCGLGAPLGVLATDDIDALLALEPDCVIYTPLHFDADEVARILSAGVNVVTTAEFLTGRGVGPEATAAVRAAALAGGATLFGTGVNPGWAQLLSVVGAGISIGVRKLVLVESVDIGMFVTDPNFEEVGWGRPAGDPGHAADVEKATAVFADSIDVVAALVGLDIEEVVCTVEFAHAADDLELDMLIPKGHVAGIDVRWDGLVGGEVKTGVHIRWIASSNLDKDWPVEGGHVVEVEGDPNVRIKVDVWPDGDLEGMTLEDFRAIGMRMTAVPPVNAIPAVCAAGPGIKTYADLPVISTRMS